MPTEGLIATADLNADLDLLIGAYRKLEGSAAAAFGAGVVGGSWGAIKKVTDMRDAIFASDAIDVISGIGSLANQLKEELAPDKVMGRLARNFIRGLSGHIARFTPDSS